MGCVFNIDFRSGSTAEQYTRELGVNVGNSIVKGDNGLVYRAEQVNTGELVYPNMPALNFGTNPFTFACAFKMGEFKNIGSMYNSILGGDEASFSTHAKGITLCYNSTNILHVVLGDFISTGLQLHFTSAGNLNDGKEHLLELDFDGTTYQGYLDNVLITSSTSVKSIENTDPFYIGRSYLNIRRSNCEVKFVKAYDHCFTADERSALYTNFLSPSLINSSNRDFYYPKATDLSNEVNSTLSDELIANGSFDTDTDWIKSLATIENGVGNITGGGYVAQNVLTTGKRYKVIFTLSNYISGNSGISSATVSGGYYPNANGTFEVDFVHNGSTSGQFRIATNPASVTVDSVSVKEITGLVASYNMIPSPNNVLVDLSGNGNNGVISNCDITKDGMAFGQLRDSSVYVNPTSIPLGWSALHRVYYDGTSNYVTFFSGSHATSPTFRFLTKKMSIYTVPTTTNGVINYPAGYYTFCYGVKSTGMPFFKLYNGESIEGNAGDVSAATTFFNLGRQHSILDRSWAGEMIDFKLYNYIVSDEQFRDYHNSWVRPSLVESFKDAGAGCVTKTIKDWSGVDSNVHAIKEISIEQGELVTNGGFDTDTWWNKQTGWTISGGTANLDGSQVSETAVFKAGVVTENKRYRIRFEITSIISGIFRIRLGVSVFGSNRATVGVYTEDIIAGTTAGIIGIYGAAGTIGSIDNISVSEIPALDTLDNGSKYLEKIGTALKPVGTQSKQAYGTWEWDFYKGADANHIIIPFISDDPARVFDNSYDFVFYGANESLWIRSLTNGTGSAIFATAANYLKNNTWYRIKIARLASEGVFEDIDNLVTNGTFITDSDWAKWTGWTISGGMANASGVTYSNFLSQSLVAASTKYRISFEVKDYVSGGVGFVLEGGSAGTGVVRSANGIYTEVVTSISTGNIYFRGQSGNPFTGSIDNVVAQQVYPADTFALFIKGGEYGKDDWTLVSAVGGTGTNPFLNSVHTTSDYFVIDSGNGDRVTNIKLIDGNIQ